MGAVASGDPEITAIALARRSLWHSAGAAGLGALGQLPLENLAGGRHEPQIREVKVRSSVPPREPGRRVSKNAGVDEVLRKSQDGNGLFM